MRPHGKTKLGFYPLPVPEAERLKNCLVCPSEFSALDPCVGDGVAFAHLLLGTEARRYGSKLTATGPNKLEASESKHCRPILSMCAVQRKHFLCSISILRTILKSARQITSGMS